MMKRHIIVPALLFTAFCGSAFAQTAEYSLVTDLSRYMNESVALNGLGLSYRLVLRDSSGHMLGMQLFFNRLADRYNGVPAESRDRFYLYGASLLKPLTPFGNRYDIQLIPAIGLAIQHDIHYELNPDTLYPAFEGSPSSDPVYFYPSLELNIRHLLYKNKLGLGLSLHLRYFKPLLTDSRTSSKNSFSYGYGIAFRILYQP